MVGGARACAHGRAVLVGERALFQAAPDRALARRRLDVRDRVRHADRLPACQPVAAGRGGVEGVSQRIQEISQINRLIHEPARLAILLILEGAGEADFPYLQREGGFTQGNLSGHLSKLEEAGYVAIEKTFKGKVPLTICSLTGNGREALDEYLERMRAILKRRATGVSGI